MGRAWTLGLCQFPWDILHDTSGLRGTKVIVRCAQVHAYNQPNDSSIFCQNGSKSICPVCFSARPSCALQGSERIPSLLRVCDVASLAVLLRSSIFLEQAC